MLWYLELEVQLLYLVKVLEMCTTAAIDLRMKLDLELVLGMQCQTALNYNDKCINKHMHKCKHENRTSTSCLFVCLFIFCLCLVFLVCLFVCLVCLFVCLLALFVFWPNQGKFRNPTKQIDLCCTAKWSRDSENKKDEKDNKDLKEPSKTALGRRASGISSKTAKPGEQVSCSFKEPSHP